MSASLIARITRHIAPSSAEFAALEMLAGTERQLERREGFSEAGDALATIVLVTGGLVARSIRVGEASRRVVAFHVPGDVCNLDVSPARPLDFRLEAMTPAQVLMIDRADYERLREVGRLGLAFDAMRDVDAAVSRSWLTNVAGRRSDMRLAHLMCELDLRVPRAGHDCLPFDLTQEDWADCIGVSPVQANRAMASLRNAKLLIGRGRGLGFGDHLRLARLSGFDPAYLN